MEALVEGLRAAETVGDLSRAVVEEAQRRIGFSAHSMVRTSGPVLSPADVAVLNGRERTEQAARERVLSMVSSAERDLVPFSVLFGSQQRTFDVRERFPVGLIRHTELFNEFWRPYGVEQQLVGLLGPPAEPIGFVCICRSARELAFSGSDLRAFEEIRRLVERELLIARRLAPGGLDAALLVLSALPAGPWLLFDARGHVLWLTDAARARFAADAFRFASSLSLRHSDALAALQRWVRAQVSGPPGAPLAAAPEGVARPGEELFLRRYECAPGRPVYLVGVVTWGAADGPAAAPAPGWAALGRVEAQVAALAAEGYQVLNIAARLGVSESTVRTHLRRVYAKLGVHSRVELARALGPSR